MSNQNQQKITVARLEHFLASFGSMTGLGRSGFSWKASSYFKPDTLSQKQYGLLEILSLATHEKLDVGSLVSNLSKEQTGSYRQILRRLAKRISDQGSLQSALEQTPDALDDDQVLAIRCGSNSGMLFQTFASLLRARLKKSDIDNQGKSNRAYYVVLSLVIAFLVMTMSFFIVPKLLEINSEFETPVDSTFLWFRRMIDFLPEYFTLTAVGILALGFLYRSSIVRRCVRRNASAWTSLFQSRAKAPSILRVLAIACDSDRPVSGVMSTLAKYHYDRSTRQRLLLARNEMEQGETEWTSLVKANLLTVPEAELLRLAPNQKSLAWVLDHLASSKEVAIRNRKMLLQAFVHPIVMILIGLFVLWICVAFFSTIPQTVKSLS